MFSPIQLRAKAELERRRRVTEDSDEGGGYQAYGNVKQAIECADSEVMLAGPADTGKTFGILHKLHWTAQDNPGASIVIARKQLTDIYPTVLVTFRKKVIANAPFVRTFGGEKAQWFDYPNGSRIWVAGLDKPGKVLSGEHDIIYVNQAEECSLADWETLTTRTTGRAGHVRHPQTTGDCNPSHSNHWIMQRSRNGGLLTRFDSTHQDNPELFDQETGEITEEGERRIGALKRLTGSRLMRLYHGLWAAPEGAIYDIFEGEEGEYGQRKHVVTAFDPPLTWPRVVGIDPFGAQVAAVWLAFDSRSGILNVYREYCQPFGLTTAGHAANVLKLADGETVFAWVCGGPSERAWRLEWEAAGIPVIEPPIGDLWVGIDRVYQLLAEFKLVIHSNCVGLISEIGDYRRKMARDGTPTETIEQKERYHLADSLRYAIVWLTKPREQAQVMTLPWQYIR